MRYKYQVGGSLGQDSPSYVVRQADLELLTELRQGQLCYIFNARQMGKSSLRVRAMHELHKQGWRCGAVDLTILGTQAVTLEQWYASLVAVIAQNFDLDLDVPTWWRSQGDLSALSRLMTFLRDVLLKQCQESVILFIDEIDSTLLLPFPTDDFWGLIRATYDCRTEDPEFRRLTWVLLGVATPQDLIRDRSRSPFGVGRAISLQGFQEHEVLPLFQGLVTSVSQPMIVLRAILRWSGGQPFLTQKLCQLVAQASQRTIQGKLTLPPGMEEFWVDQLVQTYVLQDWESQDNPEHLRSIRDRLLCGLHARSLLQLYRHILTTDDFYVTPTDLQSPDLQQLLLSGLVEQQNLQLQVKNPIYQSVFNLTWVDQQLKTQFPDPPNWLATLLPQSKELLPTKVQPRELLPERLLDLQALQRQVQRLRRQRNLLLIGCIGLILGWIVQQWLTRIP
ncbi:MAG: AAA-like domain-containing protein [Synechococcales bacterium]|nr:AAA-like domain-containing protein [Synechococcales bacterium]